MPPKPRKRPTLVLALTAPVFLTAQLIAQSPPATAQQQLDTANLRAILSHLLLINTPTPKTGQPLVTNLPWGLASQPSSTCPAPHPAGNQPCIHLTYNAPDAGVACEWLVMLPPDGSLAILSENDDAARYFMQNLSSAEAAPLVLTRTVPTYPAAAASVQGDVVLQVVVNTNGKPASATSVTSPPEFREVSLDAIGGWTFKPLQVGTRTVPFQTVVTFHFAAGKVTSTP